MSNPTLRPDRNPYVTDGPTADDLATACEIRDRILESEGDRVIKIIFYGSRAKGCPEPESDFDILVIMHDVTEEDRPSEGDRITNALIPFYPVLPDIKVHFPELFEESVREGPGYVGYEADKTGIVLYSV